MSIIKQSFILCCIVLCYIISRSNALQCKTCEQTDSSCLFAQDTKIRLCENEDDVCYSWYYRDGDEMGVRRDCISINSSEYHLIKDIIGTKDSSCLKRIHGLDCFTFLRHTPIRRASTLAEVIKKCLNLELDSIRQAGTWKFERIISTSQSSHIKIENSKHDLLNFCANNYLGLANNSEIINAAKKALDDYSAGLSSVRFICGTQTIHKQLEQRIAKFHQREDTILYISCFDANAEIFETLLKEQDYIISDELNHASIIDGIRLCKAKRLRYKHKDMFDLELKLKESFNENNDNII
ncbi:unnamed protein product [Rotaria sp. Silwood1]|nr:unnamed protein product [Rotaria sp. Silwood1]CAF1228436.1 unnamed protein product [Rotaria sp. Silwood1]CAF3485894.1 unnamed protein product [Rotaria sp. Silwood1]CAF4519970.1 unnamed protein product [Rotaria sp. Silwood1]CAF4605359.1 unnamed protein product [Rotaria sp. Silwood1]